ncbi:MAG: hypothetical protein Fur0016_15210 [Anaerolineales bacterium]
MQRTTLFLLLTVLLFSACTPQPTAPTPSLTAAPSPAPAFLHVQGRATLNASGQPVFLRGVNMDTYYYSFTWDKSAAQAYASQADIERLKDLGVNVIRLGLHWRYFETPLGYDLIDSYLDWCEQAGIYVILDMHVVPPEEDIFQSHIWSDPAAQEQMLRLWTDLATRYADRPMLAGYDLFNEPVPPRADDWWALAERLAAAIRSVDKNHILFVENPLIEESAFRLLPDSNVVYSFHEYEPFIVTHAGAEWVGDSPIPADNAYPGPILTRLEWVNFSEDAAALRQPTAAWTYWDSGDLRVPPGVEFATLKLAADGGAGAVWFDDLELDWNGAPQTLYNPDMETPSVDDSSRPANWTFWSDSGFSGEWSSEQAHSGNHSLKILGDGEGFGIWTQSNWIFTRPLFRVQAGDVLRVRGWLYAPQNESGGVSLGLDYLNGVYQQYDRARLRANLQPFLDWGAAHNVPLQVGEFGAMPNAPADSRWNWVADQISVMNEAGLHWALWTYRDSAAEAPSFGLVHGAELDSRLADILRQSLTQP